MRRYLLPISIQLVALFAGCHAGHDHEAEDHDHDHGHEAVNEADTHKHANEVLMESEEAESAGITYETVQPSEFHQSVKAAGEIETSRGASRVIVAPAAGIVSFRSGLVAGSSVRAGEALFSISSQGIEQSDATSTVHIDKAIAEKELRRAEELIKDDLISRKEYERIRADYDRASAMASTVAARGRAGIGVSAPMGGYLVRVDVAPGAFVNVGDPLATVAADRRLVLRADISERHRDFVHSIVSANISMPGSDETISLSALHPRLLSVSPTAAEGSHYLPIYIEFDNPGTLGSGSVVETWLLGSPRHEVISVPRKALIEEGGYYYVYVLEHDEGHKIFHKTPVSLGASDGERIEIVSGLSGGEKIASTGAARIRMAGMGAAIPGHSHHH